MYAPENIADPHPYLAWIRSNEPVFQGPDGVYLVSTYAGCLALFDPTLFRAPDAAEMLPPGPRSRTLELLADTVAMRNPPEHTRLRRFFTRDFTVRRVEALRAPTGRICDAMLDGLEERLRSGVAVDLVSALTMALPMQVIAELIGVPASDRTWLFGHVAEVLAVLTPGVSEDTAARGDKASTDVESYYRELAAQRRAAPRDDLTSVWVRGMVDERMTFDELLGMLWAMVAGGFATTSSALATGALVLLQHGFTPDRGFAEEVLRYESPSFIGGVPKIALRDVVVEGVTIPEGSLARTMLTSAGRDAAVYSSPDSFDPLRDNSKSLGFGHGTHLCIGANLARMELTTLLPRLRSRFPALELAGEPVWQAPKPIRGLSRLGVRLRR